MVDVLGVPVLAGRKTARERFAGAIRTWTLEAMMGDGKALQMGTSHELGQNFAKAFGIQFSSDTGSQEYVWQTSWGASTRLVGALIMAHGDDAGLRLPPRLAPVQVVVILVRDDEDTRRAASKLVEELRAAGLRVRLDDRVGTSFGWRSVDWELKGVPVRIEVGPRDLAAGEVTLVRRDLREKRRVALAAAAAEAGADLETVQSASVCRSPGSSDRENRAGGDGRGGGGRLLRGVRGRPLGRGGRCRRGGAGGRGMQRSLPADGRRIAAAGRPGVRPGGRGGQGLLIASTPARVVVTGLRPERAIIE